MPDPVFYRRSGPFSLSRLADIAGAELSENVRPDMMIEDVAPLDSADGRCLSFLDNLRYKDQFLATKAGACIVAPSFRDQAPPGMALLLTNIPYKAYALAAQAFYPEDPGNSRIEDTAVIAPDVKIGGGCSVGHHVVVGARASVGEGSILEPGAVIGPGVTIGKHCRIGANATVTHSLIGDRVRIYSGCRIGQDGFGFAIDPAGHVKVPQLGRVIIGDNVEIGANTTIDRGAGPDTVIGDGTWIDNLVQIGHNVKIGRGCVIVAQVGLSGSVVVEDYAVLAGQSGVAGHLRIGKGARIGAQAGVMRDVPAGEQQVGSPAMPLKQFMRQVATLGRLAGRGNES